MSTIKLAVITKNIEDIPGYYELYQQIEERSPIVDNHVFAGLFVAGKYFLAKREVDDALDLFETLTSSCKGEKRFIWGVISTLAERGMYSELNKHFSCYKEEDRDSCEYLLSAFFISSTELNDSEVIAQGLELFQKEVKDPVSYKIVIEKMFQADRQQEAQNLIALAKEQWPDKARLFKSLNKDKRMAA